MKRFDHVNAESITQTVELLQQYGNRACLIAGGTDLLGVLKDRILPHYPEILINLKTIPGLDVIEENEEGLRIGSLAKLADIAANPLVKERYGILALAALSVATPQIRNMATIGGNLAQDTRCWYYRYPHHLGGRLMCARKGNGPCFAVSGDNRYHSVVGGRKCFAACPSDMAVALAALDATVVVTGPAGERTIPVADFFHPLGNALRDGEMITEILVPRPPHGVRQNFLKYTLRKPVDFAVVSVATVIAEEGGYCREARIVLGAVAPAPVRATDAEQVIAGRVVDSTTAELAVQAALTDARPLSMNAYKIGIARELVRKSLLDL